MWSRLLFQFQWKMKNVLILNLFLPRVSCVQFTKRTFPVSAFSDWTFSAFVLQIKSSQWCWQTQAPMSLYVRFILETLLQLFNNFQRHTQIDLRLYSHDDDYTLCTFIIYSYRLSTSLDSWSPGLPCNLGSSNECHELFVSPADGTYEQ